MNGEIEKIDSRRAEILGELVIEYENDEEITKPESAQEVKIFVGALADDVVVSSESRRTGRITGDLVVEKENIDFVAESIEKLLKEEKPWEIFPARKAGRDDILVFFQSSWAHNLPAPFERIVVRNRREYELDGLRASLLGLELPPRTAQQFAALIRQLFK